MRPWRIIQVSDTHLSQATARTAANWQRTVAYVNRTKPDLLVHSGDILLHDPDDVGDHEYAHGCLAGLACDWCTVPGNHDIGDSPPTPGLGHHITPQRRERYRAHWGPDWWSRAFGDWRLLGLNCLLFDTRLDEERAQWDWLADELLRHRDRPVGLFMHKPLFLASGDEEFENDAAIPRAARRRMAGLLKGSSVRLIASGHRHEYRTYHWNGIAIVWAPTTSFIANRRTPLGQEGIRRAGCVQYEFFEETCVYRFVEPEGIEYFDDRFLHELRRDRGLSYDPQVFR